MFLCFRSGVYSSSATLAGSGKLNTTQPAGPTSNGDGSAAFVRRFIGCRTLEKGQALSYTKREREKSRKFWDADRRFDPTAPLLRVVVSVYFILFYCFSLCDSFFSCYFSFFSEASEFGEKGPLALPSIPSGLLPVFVVLCLPDVYPALRRGISWLLN